MDTYAYKVFSSDDALLYVGITRNVQQRMSSHAYEKPWWEPEVDYIIIKKFPTREAAEEYERTQIAVEAPRYNVMSGVSTKKKSEKSGREYRRAKTHLPLPESELEYLKTLSSDDTYIRCAELADAGWSIKSILQGAKVAPTYAQLCTELKYIRNANSGVPIPEVPPTPRQEARGRKIELTAARNNISEEEKELLIHYANLSKKRRPQFGPDHPVVLAVEEYRELIRDLHARGVSMSAMARVVGVNESAIRRRFIGE